MPGTTVAAGLCGATESLTRARGRGGGAYLCLMRGRFGTGSTVVLDGGTVLVRPRAIPCLAPSRNLPRSAPQPALKCTCAVVTTVPRRGKSRRTDASCSGAVRAAIASSANTRS